MYRNLRLRPYFRILACTVGSLRQKLALALVYRDLLYLGSLFYRAGHPFLHALPKLTWWLLSVLYFLQIFLDRFIDHVLLIPWLCAGLLGGKSEVRCATILTVARSQKNQNSNFGCTGTIFSICIKRSKSVKIRDFLF